MPMTFGSVGDIITLAGLVKDLAQALHKSRGAAAEYQSLIQDLNILEGTLQHLHACFQAQQDAPEVIALNETGRRIEAACSQSIKAFRARIDKYDKTLGGADVNKIKSTYAKFRWQTGEKAELASFRITIAGHTASMNMLLNVINMAINYDNRASLKSIQASNQDYWTQLQSSLSAVMDVINEIAKIAMETRKISFSILGSLRFFQQVGYRLMDGLSQIVYMNFATYRAVLAIQAAIPSQCDRMLLGEHFVLEDAMGQPCPILLKCITSWEALEFILADRFLGKPAYDKVCRREYALQERASSFDISRRRNWEGAFTPGEWYDMSMLFVRESKAKNSRSTSTRQTSSCPGCLTEINGSQDCEVRCPGCGMWYRRITETINIDPGASHESSTPVDGTSQSRFEALRPSPKFGPERIPKSSKHTETNLDDIASFKRVRILLRQLLDPVVKDSGYETMSRSQNLEIDQDDAWDAISVRTDEGDPRLAVHSKDLLVMHFTQQILNDMSPTQDRLANAADYICSSLPSLLREFSASLGQRATPGAEQRACVFVRHQRNQITQQFREVLMSNSYALNALDASTLHDKINVSEDKDRSNLSLRSTYPIGDSYDALNYRDLSDLESLPKLSDLSNDLLNMHGIEEARAYLIGSPEYGWLLGQILTKARTLT